MHFRHILCFIRIISYRNMKFPHNMLSTVQNERCQSKHVEQSYPCIYLHVRTKCSPSFHFTPRDLFWLKKKKLKTSWTGMPPTHLVFKRWNWNCRPRPNGGKMRTVIFYWYRKIETLPGIQTFETYTRHTSIVPWEQALRFLCIYFLRSILRPPESQSHCLAAMRDGTPWTI